MNEPFDLPAIIPPCDWDQESFCWEDGCVNPATHRRLYTTNLEGDPWYEMVCCDHATTR